MSRKSRTATPTLTATPSTNGRVRIRTAGAPRKANDKQDALAPRNFESRPRSCRASIEVAAARQTAPSFPNLTPRMVRQHLPGLLKAGMLHQKPATAVEWLRRAICSRSQLVNSAQRDFCISRQRSGGRAFKQRTPVKPGDQIDQQDSMRTACLILGYEGRPAGRQQESRLTALSQLEATLPGEAVEAIDAENSKSGRNRKARAGPESPRSPEGTGR